MKRMTSAVLVIGGTVLATTVVGTPVSASSDVSASAPTTRYSHIHEGKRCKKSQRGKTVRVGNKWHSVLLKCKVASRHHKHVYVWKYNGGVMHG